MMASVGARPMRAKVVVDETQLIQDYANEKEGEQFAEMAAETLCFQSNMRASAEDRNYITKRLIKRACRIMAQRRNEQ